MPDSIPNSEPGTTDPPQPIQPAGTGSAKYFEAERSEESRKRFASYSLWAGMISLLLLLIPNPIPWLLGPVAIALGIHALIRIHLQPKRHAGTARALVGISIGLLSTLACRWWLR